MGTTGFWSYFSSLVKTIHISKIKNKMIFIDVVLYIHKYVIGIRKSGNDIKLNNGKNVTHIHAMHKIIKPFIDVNILPICVFDGKAPITKEETIEKRKDNIENSFEKCNKLKENNISEKDEEYIKYFKRSFILTQDMIEECKEFLDNLGLPYVNSIGEADPQCAGLSHYYANYCAGVYSEDSDIILNGGSILLRDLNLKDNTISYITKESIINFLQEKCDIITEKYKLNTQIITHETLINFSHIMGNDYCNGIRCSGGNNRDKLFEIFVCCNFDVELFVEIIYEFNKEKIMYYIPEDFLIKWKISKNIFENIQIINPSEINLILNKININNVHSFFEYNEFKKETTINIIYSINILYENYSNFMKKLTNDYMEIINNTKCNNLNRMNDNEWKTVSKKKKYGICN
jgi:flap endonuclease-1